MDDGVQLAATLYEPSAAPAARRLAGRRRPARARRQEAGPRTSWRRPSPSSFAVLTFDERGHGQSGGLVSIDGPQRDRRRARGLRLARCEARDRPEPHRRLGHLATAAARSCARWSRACRGRRWRPSRPGPTSTARSFRRGCPKSGALLQFLTSVPENRLDPSVLAIRNDALASTNLPALHGWADVRSSAVAAGAR